MTRKEGRLSRWSTLKSKGGASVEENEAARKAVETATRPEATEQADPHSQSGDLAYSGSFSANPYKRPAAPVMAPLGGVEDGDDSFQGAPEAALALLNGGDAEGAGKEDPDLTANQATSTDAEPELTPEEMEAVAGLPAIETLTQDSDFTPFMSDKIPEFIRRKALNVLYQSHPILGLRDGLNDYDEDYNLIHTLIDAATQSSYIVGKGQSAAQEVVLPKEAEAEKEEEGEAESALQSETGTEDCDETASDDGPANAPDAAAKDATPSPEPETDQINPVAEDVPSTKSLRDVRKPGSPDAAS